MTSEFNLLLAMFYLLGAALITVPIAKRLGLGSVLGYLMAGIVIGPWGFGAIDDPSAILHFSEFGVVLLLFLIGLELRPALLRELRVLILGVGWLQVALTTLALFAIGVALALPWQDALVIAMGLALSSTAIALKSLEENNLLPTQMGKASFAILLFQDLAVIPMLAILPWLTPSTTASGSLNWMLAGQAVIAIVVVVGMGPWVIRPLLKLMAATGLREIFTAFSLALLIGVALLMEQVGLSMALGTFLVGVLLAESEYRHALEADIRPLKGLLMGLFFIAVGMSVNFALLLAEPLLMVGLVLGLLAVKIAVLWGLAWKAQLAPSQRLAFAFLLSQGGEFAFVLFTAAVAAQALTSILAERMILVVTLSMLMTPVLAWLERRFIAPRFQRVNPPPPTQIEESPEGAVMIAGFGRFGQVVGRFLHAHQIATILLDHDPDHIAFTQRLGFKVFFGDATRLDLLQAAGADKCRALVIALDDKAAALKLADMARSQFPHLPILVRAWDLPHLFQFQDLGIDNIRRETFDSALALAEDTLRELGYSAILARRSARLFRKHEAMSIQQIYQARKESPERGIEVAISAREEIERLLALDEDHPLLEEDSTVWQ